MTESKVRWKGGYLRFKDLPPKATFSRYENGDTFYMKTSDKTAAPVEGGHEYLVHPDNICFPRERKQP
jgi:hypothetical protein